MAGRGDEEGEEDRRFLDRASAGDLISLQSWCVNDPIRLLEARLQAIDDFRFEAPPSNGRFLSQPTMKLFGQAKADRPPPRAFHQRKASRSKGKADNQSDNDCNRDAHGDTPPLSYGYNHGLIDGSVTDRNRSS